MQTCLVCKGEMRKKGSVNSGNSVFVTYTCRSCGKDVTRCEGLSGGKGGS